MLFRPRRVVLTLCCASALIAVTALDAEASAAAPVPGQLTGVSCLSARSCTAVGFGWSNAPGGPIVGQWNGSTWSFAITPPAGGEDLLGISCSPDDTCAAVGSVPGGGSAIDPFAMQSGAKGWTTESVPSPPGESNSHLSAASCASASACTAVGDGFGATGGRTPLAENWNGTQWTIEATPATPGASSARLFAVSCTASTDCMAVGRTAYGGGRERTLAEHWDGSQWTITPTSTPQGSKSDTLGGVSCPSATECFAEGSYVGPQGQELLVERWNGTSWSIARVPHPAGYKYSTLFSVSCSAANACTAVGRGGSKGLFAERFNGNGWTSKQILTPRLGLITAGSVSCPGRWSCTAGFTVTRQSGGIYYQHGVAARWYFGSWTQESLTG